jgi:enterochelin esterase-like enzyme
MQLTSGFLLAVVVILYLAFFGVLIFRWNAIKNILVRATSIIVINLLLLMSVGLALNNSYGFYNSWNELFGISTQGKSVINPSQIDLSKAKYTSNGSAMLQETFTGNISKITASVWFLIPKSIVAAIKNNSSNKFPVAVFLSGSPGVPTAWLNGLKLDNQIQQAKGLYALKDFIAVLPDYNIEPHQDTGCMNIPNGVQVEDWLTSDVYGYVIKNLPAKQNSWVVTGYSTGGWCASMLAIKHSEIFKGAAPIAGYYQPEPPLNISNTVRNTLKQEYDLIKLSKLRSQPVDIFLITSKADASSYKSTNWFYSRIGAGNNVELLTLQSGGHNFTTWRPVVQDVLKWFATEFV